MDSEDYDDEEYGEDCDESSGEESGEYDMYEEDSFEAKYGEKRIVELGSDHESSESV